MAPFAPTCIEALKSILGRVCANPTNPTFNHYLFETVASLVKFICAATPAAVDAFEQLLFPPFQARTPTTTLPSRQPRPALRPRPVLRLFRAASFSRPTPNPSTRCCRLHYYSASLPLYYTTNPPSLPALSRRCCRWTWPSSRPTSSRVRGEIPRDRGDTAGGRIPRGRGRYRGGRGCEGGWGVGGWLAGLGARHTPTPTPTPRSIPPAVLAQLLESRSTLSPAYSALFPPLLAPTMWERPGNVSSSIVVYIIYSIV